MVKELLELEIEQYQINKVKDLLELVMNLKSKTRNFNGASYFN